ncbi:methyl-accepting chemotaxis protein [Trichlorobacter lovleyi]|uniref:methyl-accepting chemotaxis protein n=1 Tax=Trichlorobacter lovleyi TaxID=313985 RepID=UPI00248115D2|nr:methyl-accepting chemotaxis protein [Trichlorobacter lovleyi]
MNWFANLSIRSKLRLSFSIMLVIVATLGSVALYSLFRLDTMVLDMQQGWLPRVKYTMTMTREMTAFRVLEFHHLLATTKDEKVAIEKRMSALYANYTLLRDKTDQLVPPGDNPPRKLFTASEDARKKYWTPHTQAMELSYQNRVDAALDVLTQGSGLAEFEHANDKIRELADLAMAHSENTATQANQLYHSVRNIVVLTIVVALAIGILLALYITRLLSAPITALTTGAHKIAGGDLTIAIQQNSHDEIGDLAAAFNQMANGLQHFIAQVSGTSDSLASESEKLTTSATEMHSALSKIVDQATVVATASEEMAATSSEISQSCQMAADSAHQATSSAEDGVVVVKTSIDIMARVVERVREASLTVEQLGARSDQIGAIVGTIEDIADQTNLLALNAAIEAARAGEQGRGFAVVADEVRALAERTTKATREIGEMIKAIQQETRAAVSSMKEGSAEVERGTDGANKSGQALDIILEQVSAVTAQINQIATAATEQTATTHEISKNTHEMSVSSQVRMHDVQSTQDSARQLGQHATSLKELVSRFKLHDLR